MDRYCVICRNLIPDDRRKDAVTCGKLCQKRRRDSVRAMQDLTFCRYCSKPSTPEQRHMFALWKKWARNWTAEDVEAFMKWQKQQQKESQQRATTAAD